MNWQNGVNYSIFGSVQVPFICRHGFGELASNCSLLAGKHVKCDATDQWAKNESATVGSSLEEKKLAIGAGVYTYEMKIVECQKP